MDCGLEGVDMSTPQDVADKSYEASTGVILRTLLVLGVDPVEAVQIAPVLAISVLEILFENLELAVEERDNE
jgi:hypothetical protein